MTDYLAYMQAERKKLGEEFNRIREKLISYNDIIRQLEEKTIAEDTKDYEHEWFSILPEAVEAIKALGTLDKPIKVKFDHRRRRAVSCDDHEVCRIPYDATCEILGIKK